MLGCFDLSPIVPKTSGPLLELALEETIFGIPCDMCAHAHALVQNGGLKVHSIFYF